MTEKGSEVRFLKGQCTIFRQRQPLFTTTEKGGLYELHLSHRALKVSGTGTQCIHFWHRRLGHHNSNAIKLRVKKDLATGIALNDRGHLETFECCIKAKMTKMTTPKVSFSRTT